METLFCINEHALYGHGSSWLLHLGSWSTHWNVCAPRLYSRSSQTIFLPCLTLSSCDSVSANPTFIYLDQLSSESRYLPDYTQACVCLTGTANLCVSKTKPLSSFPNLPSPTFPGSSTWEVIQCNSIYCWFPSSHFSLSPSLCPCPCPLCLLPGLWQKPCKWSPQIHFASFQIIHGC